MRERSRVTLFLGPWRQGRKWNPIGAMEKGPGEKVDGRCTNLCAAPRCRRLFIYPLFHLSRALY